MRCRYVMAGELLSKVVALALTGLGVFAVGFLAMQRHVLFPAPQWGGPTLLGLGVEEIAVDIGGAFLALPERGPLPAPLIVYAHGNAELAIWSLERLAAYRALGFAVLLLEYPGYGGTAGSPSSASIEASALQAFDAVITRQDISEGRVIAYGRSIGTGIASVLARERRVAALVLEAPFLSLRRLVSSKGFPGFLLLDRFDNAAIVSTLGIPVLIYHGTEDAVIPHAHGQRLADMARHGHLISPRCGHNDCPSPVTQVMAFLSRNGLASEL
ncbi:MAG: alpha/beta hydrolase [Pseudomonadota bacterium]